MSVTGTITSASAAADSTLSAQTSFNVCVVISATDTCCSITTD
jgi:hypothetical protein